MRRGAPVVWSVGLALLMLGPALGPGLVLSYDMVWVPDLALRPDFAGVGSALPRAVPSDAVISIADEVIPGQLLQRLILLGSLVGAGVGASRLLPDLPLAGRLSAMTIYQWNPFVVERLVIGHWPVLVGYAVLPWVLVLGTRWRREGQLPVPLLVLLPLGCLSAGAGLVTALALFLSAGTRVPRRLAVLSGLALAANAPWLVSGILHAGTAVTAPESADLFALSSEGQVPGPLAALTLGGIWNAEVVPGSREGLLGWVSVLFLVLVVIVGARRWWRAQGALESARLLVLAGVGLGLALLTWAATDAVGWAIDAVPGAGVLRDGSRWLAAVAPVLAGLTGCAAARVCDAVGAESRVPVAIGCAVVPLLLLPDAALGISGQLRGVDFPTSYDVVREVVRDGKAGADGDVLLLPLTSYRQPEWNNEHKVLDPIGRYLTPDYVASDELLVDDTRLPGEDPRVPRMRTALAAATPGERAEQLADLGIEYVVFDDAAPGDSVDVGGILLVEEGDLRAYGLEDAEERQVPTSWWVAMALAWVGFAAAPLLAGVTALRRASRRVTSRGRRHL